MKTKSIIFVYGEGGHKAQMKRLLHLMRQENNENIKYIGVCENNSTLETLDENYSFLPLRDKYSNLRTVINIPIALFSYLKILFVLHKKYDVKAVVSTGPGIAIIVSLFFKIFGKKIIFIETWSRFETKSITGKIMYKVADKFYIQNKSLQKHYPKAIYGGLL
jgi:beta-1,4-N-acetylglucosaminyltransferase